MSWIENPVDGLNVSDLYVDQAWLNVSTPTNAPFLWLYSVSSNCYQCPFTKQNVDPINPSSFATFKIDTKYPSRYRLRSSGNLTFVSEDADDPQLVCETDYERTGEFGVYQMLVDVSSPKCSFTNQVPPVNIYLPLLLLFLVYTVLVLSWVLISKYKNFLFEECTSNRNQRIDQIPESNASLLSSSSDGSMQNSSSTKKQSKKKTKKKVGQRKPEAILNERESSSSSALTQESSTRSEPALERLRCIDAFRGLCIIIMIFVDDGGGHYYFFEHCTWDGLYVADVAFPWFLWIMGACIPISIQLQRKRGTSFSTMLSKIVRRSIKLIVIGLCLNTTSKLDAVQLSKLRIPGVLQRFGICYFIMTTLILCCSKDENMQSQGFCKKLKQWIPCIFVIAGVILHTLIIFLLPVPGCPTGYLGPGGLHMNNTFSSHCIGGSAGYIDRLILTNDHIYRYPTAYKVYNTGAFDPEGILATLNCLLQVYLGIQAGKIFLVRQNSSQRLVKLACFSISCFSCGLILCGGLSNSGWIPVNKNLWSLSYTLITSSFAFLILMKLYFVIDLKNLWFGSPLIEAGMNSIFLYVGHVVAQNMLPFNFAYGQMNTHFSHLVENLWGISLWVGLAVYLHHKKLFFVV